jgi:hypothetical protein
MKKGILAIGLAGIMIGCLVEEELNNKLVVPTCYDGILNQDETEIDCGGRCTLCVYVEPVVVPCQNLSDNRISYNGSSYNSSFYYDGTDESSYEVAILLQNNVQVSITISGALSNVDKKYTATQGWLATGEANITVYGSFYNHTSTAGDIYLTDHADKTYIEFCDVTMVSNYDNGFSISGRVVLP